MAYNTAVSVVMAERNIDGLAEEYSAEIASSITAFVDSLSRDVLDNIIASTVM